MAKEGHPQEESGCAINTPKEKRLEPKERKADS
jgi:hypothetical protein